MLVKNTNILKYFIFKERLSKLNSYALATKTPKIATKRKIIAFWNDNFIAQSLRLFIKNTPLSRVLIKYEKYWYIFDVL